MRKIHTVWYTYILAFLVFTLFLGYSPKANATHIRAGEITVKSDTVANPNPLRFHFKLVTYVVTSAGIPDPDATFFFGDGTNQTVSKASNENLPGDITRRVFYASHTYPAAGIYNVVYNELNRNSSIQNISNPNGNSFLIQTTFTINPQIGINRSPQFSVPPLDVAASGQIFIHFPGAFDLDQDSLAYRLVTPLRNTSGNPTNIIQAPVTGYNLPNNPPFSSTAINDPVTGAVQGAPARFDLNQKTGEIRWNVPSRCGEYNVAFVVEEWRLVPNRRAIKLGEVTRDMQIRVECTNNIRPALVVPPDTCVIANTLLRGFVTATDPNTPPDPLVFNAYSGILPPAQFSQTSGTGGLFQWTPQCTDISDQPYQVIFKVNDNPVNNDPDLVDLKAWNVRVVGPKPTGLTATLQPGKQMLLTWNPYLANGCGNAEKIHIYRRVNRANFNPTNCQTGVPSSTGYVKIGEVAAGISTFTDTNNGQGLKSGANYCYLIYASFPAPKRGESLASLEVCAEVPLLASVLTNVSVTETSKTAGKIFVRWTRPVGGLANYPGPHQYRLFRAFGKGDNRNFQQIHTASNPADTTFTDQNLNTQDSTYTYKVEFYYGSPTGLRILDEGSEASSVRLEAESDGVEMSLSWSYETPWNNGERKHLIYREINNVFTLIDSVQAGQNQGAYIDRGTFDNQPLVIGKEYCYYIETVGTYTNTKLPPVVRNNSQIKCQIMRDNEPPCPPVLTLALINCDSLQRTPFRPPFQNKLKWNPAFRNECDTDIASYNVYFRQPDGGEFQLISNTPSLSYLHQGLNFPAACYAVTAIDSSGNESKFSNIVCQDICFFLELPNIITPNNDGRNDTFRPRQSAFIRSVNFTVYNRWGTKVYSNTTGPNIDWAGVTDSGNRLSDGVYYYLADIEFAGNGQGNTRKVFKGWVEIVR